MANLDFICGDKNGLLVFSPSSKIPPIFRQKRKINKYITEMHIVASLKASEIYSLIITLFYFKL